MPIDLLIYAILRRGGRTRARRRVCDSNGMLWALLRQYVRPYRRLLGVVAVLQVISTLASLYLPTINAAIIDDGVAKGDTAAHHRIRRRDARGDRPAGGVRRRGGLLRVAGEHGCRPRSALGDLSPCHRVLGRGDRALRRAVAADPDDQRRSADPVAGAADLHDADHRADHVRRRHLHGHPPGRRPVVAAADQRPGARGRQLLDRVASAADLPAHAATDRRHQPRDARTAFRHPGDPGVRAGTVRARPIRARPTRSCPTPR